MMITNRVFTTLLGLTLWFPSLKSAVPADLREAVASQVKQDYPELLALYRHLHTHPELSFQEQRTSARIAEELRPLGFEVTTNVGGFGLVAVLKNGAGPTVLIRTDLDALPVKEETGLPYASTAKATDDKGRETDVMHACGHDVHMTVFAGVARMMSRFKDRWHGTLVMIGQPAEERGSGARAMLKDGLYSRFPRPDFCLALHVNSELPAGTIGWVEGFAMANVDSVDVVIRGVGGHGAFPHKTKDPVVLAAETILALQTIVSREIRPGEPAVVTVGSIHGGTKHNIIPEEVTLQLTLRSYTDSVREQTIAAVKRIVRGLAEAAGIPADRMPTVTLKDEFTPATFNHPELSRRLSGSFVTWLGEEQVRRMEPVMGGEDFSEFGRTPERIPICLFWLGAVNPDAWKENREKGTPLPSLHSSRFAPAPEPTIKTGITAMTAAALELMTGK